MSYVYRQRHASTSDVIDGASWNANQNELAGMFNGGLDRDNLPPNVITAAMLVLNACVKCSQYADNGGAATITSAAWQALANFSLDITATTDVMVEVDFSTTWAWNAGAWSRATASSGITYVVEAVAFRVTVNGTAVCESGPSEDQYNQDCCALIGAIPLTAGTYTVQVEYQVAQRNYYDLSVAGLSAGTLTINETALLVTARSR